MDRGHRPRPGGILGLVAFLDEHSEAVESDLIRFCNGTDLRDLYRPGGRLTFRRLRVLLDHLPMESATKTALRDAVTPEELALIRESGLKMPHGPWSRQEYLLADVVDSLNRLGTITLNANGAEAEFPPPVPRPGFDEQAKPKHEPAQVAYLQALHDANAHLKMT